MQRLIKTGLLAAAGVLASCGTLPYVGASNPEDPNYLDGSPLGAVWSGDDIRAQRNAFLEVVALPEGRTAEWKGERAHGKVVAGDAQIVLPSGRAMPAPAGLSIPGEMEMHLGDYVVTSAAHLRLGPSTDDRILATMKAGTRVDVVGRVLGEPWMLVAERGRVRGYIYEKLLSLPRGASSKIAGAPLATPGYCRSVGQSAEASGKSVKWTSLACRRGGDWYLVENN